MATLKGPDFSKKDRDVLLVTLPDGDGGGVDVPVLPPTKGIFDKMRALAEAIDSVTDGSMEASDFDIGMALDACAEAMSRNTHYRRITAQDLELAGFDIEDIGTFCAAYILFIAQLVEAKNSSARGIREL